MARQIQKQKKLVLLEKILEKKQILFAPFSDSITHEMKDAAWQEVLLVAQSQTLVNEGRDWTFVRDKIWSKLKSKALEKRDNARKSGSAGGYSVVLDEVDTKVLEIISADSPTVQGIGLVESYGTPIPFLQPPSPASISSPDPSNVTPLPSSTTHPAEKKRRASTLFSHSTSATSPTLEELRRKWLELEIRKSEKWLELAEYKAKKLKIECHILSQQVAAMEPQQADERNVEEVIVMGN
ncbi:hypothetical protein M8J76_010602 [Diaphorina citri]|nr:hypothetical protein M8J76_010602 [Diaphorina citri]